MEDGGWLGGGKIEGVKEEICTTELHHTSNAAHTFQQFKNLETFLFQYIQH